MLAGEGWIIIIRRICSCRVAICLIFFVCPWMCIWAVCNAVFHVMFSQFYKIRTIRTKSPTLHYGFQGLYFMDLLLHICKAFQYKAKAEYQLFALKPKANRDWNSVELRVTAEWVRYSRSSHFILRWPTCKRFGPNHENSSNGNLWTRLLSSVYIFLRSSWAVRCRRAAPPAANRPPFLVMSFREGKK